MRATNTVNNLQGTDRDEAVRQARQAGFLLGQLVSNLSVDKALVEHGLRIDKEAVKTFVEK